MKLLALIIALTASPLGLAQTLDATTALTDVLKLGRYSGVNLKTLRKCSLQLSNVPSGVIAKITSEDLVVERLIEFQSVYQWRLGQRFFLSSGYIRSGRNTEETVFRTIAINDSTQYIVGSLIRAVDGQVQVNQTIECAIDI